jgi:hypothetical protein
MMFKVGDMDQVEPTGYCPCCGVPRINGKMKHEYECIWWEIIDWLAINKEFS